MLHSGESMKTRSLCLGLVTALVTSSSLVVGSENDAVLLHLDDDTQQVRVETHDAATDRWLAIASGYRDNPDAGWLKIALGSCW